MHTLFCTLRKVSRVGRSRNEVCTSWPARNEGICMALRAKNALETRVKANSPGGREGPEKLRGHRSCESMKVMDAHSLLHAT